MIKYLIDTDICIHALKGRSAELLTHFEANNGAIGVSVISLFELAYGAEKYGDSGRRLDVIESFAARLDVFPFDTRAAMHAGEIRAALDRKGTPIGNFDILIAGIARSCGLSLVTGNIREFSRVEGLRLSHWM